MSTGTAEATVERKHGSMPAWCVLGVGRDSAGRLRLYWPWWSDIGGERFLTRFIVIRNSRVSISVTRIHMADNQREDPHDHSHTFWSAKAGWYAEDVYDDPGNLASVRHIRHHRFSVHRMPYTRAHSITEVSPGLWTILVSGRTRQASSYWTPAGKRSTGVNGDQEEWA